MRLCTPTRDEARELAQHHALIPVYREVLADMLTPVRAYSLLCPHDTAGFLLESVEGGERLARYSFIGYQRWPLCGRSAVRPPRRCGASRASTGAPWATSATRPPAISRSCRWLSGRRRR